MIHLFLIKLEFLGACRKQLQQTHLSFWGSGIVLEIASVSVVLHPRDLVLAHGADGVLHRLVDNRVHRRDKEVEGRQELLTILGQVPLSIFISDDDGDLLVIE